MVLASSPPIFKNTRETHEQVPGIVGSFPTLTMADAQLTPNAVKAIYGNQPCNQPVLQIVDVKKVVPNPGQQQQTNQADRYRCVFLDERSREIIFIFSNRLLVSDGINYQQGMLGTQQNALIKDGKISNNTVVRLTEYVCNTTANNRRYV